MRVFVGAMALLLSGCATNAAEPADSTAWLTHSVFFDLKDDSPTAIEGLVEGCYTYLAPHDGIVSFSAGPRHADYQRDVNDLDFEVALTIVFESLDAQEAYQVTQPHQDFIDTYSANWERVRVFDSTAPANPA